MLVYSFILLQIDCLIFLQKGNSFYFFLDKRLKGLLLRNYKTAYLSYINALYIKYHHFFEKEVDNSKNMLYYS